MSVDFKNERTQAMRKLVLVFFVTLLFCCYVRAGELFEPEKVWSFSVLLENDSKFLNFVNPDHGTDRHYTNGVKISFGTHTQEDLARKWLGLEPGFARGNEKLKTAIVGFLGQAIYTPDHVGKPAFRDSEDMPFAGWLYGGVSLQRANEIVDGKADFENFEFNIGVIGSSSKAGEAQNWIHEIFFAPEPKGWDGQLSDELAFDFRYQRKWKEVLWHFGEQGSSELIRQAGFTAGTVHRNANAGALWRIGYNLPDDFGPGSIEDTSAATGILRKEWGSFYLFARGGIKAVEHNRFLSSLQAEPFLFEGQLGVVFEIYGLELSYSQTFMSDEFEGQGDSDSFNAATISYRRSF